MLEAPSSEGLEEWDGVREVGRGGCLFFSVLPPRGGVGGCVIIQSGGVSEKLIPRPPCSENLIPPHSIPTARCYVTSKEKQFLVKSQGKSVCF